MDFDKRPGAMGVQSYLVSREHRLGLAPDDRDEDDQDSDHVPETPLDEPRPPQVQDPPPQPGQKGPYVVRAGVRYQTEG